MTALRAAKIWSSPDILPRLVSLAKCTVAEIETLYAMLSSEIDRASLAQRAKQIEHEADEIVHHIVRELAVTYNSPLTVRICTSSHRPWTTSSISALVLLIE